MVDIAITMPDPEKKGTEELIKFYEKEEGYLYYRVSRLPNQPIIGGLCFIVSNGVIIGSHKIVEASHVNDIDASMLSDGDWPAGNYIIRDATTFVRMKSKILVKGFQGFRYYDTMKKVFAMRNKE